MALCAQIDVENRLQVTFDNQPDAVVTALIADAQALIESEIGREVESDTRQETFDGGRVELFLRHFPVTAVSAVTEDGTALTIADDVKWYRTGKVIRMSGSTQVAWKTTKRQSIVVDYTGGYLTGTHDAELEHLGSVCAEVVARAFRKGADAAAVPAGAAGQVQSVSIEGSDSVTYATGGGASTALGGLSQFVWLLEDERRQLARYRGLAVA